MRVAKYIVWLVGLLLVLGVATSILFWYIPRGITFGENEVLLNGMTASLLRVELAIQTLLMFLIPAWVVFRMLDRDGLLYVHSPYMRSWKSSTGYILTGLISILVLPVVSFLGIWNASWALPDWAAQMELQAKLLTEFVLKEASVGALISNLVVCALLPSVAEELFFRGVLQTVFERATGRVQLSIWLVAAVFSFFHFQFGGFVPRLFLGLLMGYLYYFGRTLWLPVLAHFTNNAVAVIAYFVGTRYANAGMSPELVERHLEHFGTVHLACLLLACIMVYFNLCRRSRRSLCSTSSPSSPSSPKS